MDVWTIVLALLIVFVGLPIVLGTIYVGAMFLIWYLHEKKLEKQKKGKKR